jgi:hypothetical protein
VVPCAHHHRDGCDGQGQRIGGSHG